MKFTNGYWMIKPNINMLYATQCVRVEQLPGALHVLSACRPVRGRGDYLDGGNLDVTFTAPMENVIRVKVTHFAGTALKAPHFAISEQPVTPVLSDGEQEATFTSGKLTARVKKEVGAWQVDFVNDEGRVITTSGWRGMGRALDRNTGKSYMSDSLQLDVGECVYGLGERFGAYVKNGQSVDMWNAEAAPPPTWPTRTSPST